MIPVKALSGTSSDITNRPNPASLRVPLAGPPIKSTVPSQYTTSGVVDIPLIFSTQGLYNSSLDFASFPGLWGLSGAFNQTSAAGADLNHAIITSPYACDFSYANLQGAVFSLQVIMPQGDDPAAFTFQPILVNQLLDCTFFRSDLTGADLSSLAYFRQVGISSYDWTYSPWALSDFTGAILVNADLRGSNFAGCSFVGADLTGARLDQTRLDGCIWDHTTIWPSGFDPTRIPQSRSSFADYSHQDLTGMDFSYVPCMHGNFAGATLTDCYLTNPVYANFSGARIQGTTMLRSYTNFAWANFSDATVCIQSDRMNYQNQQTFGPPNIAHSVWRNAQLTIDPLSTSVGPHDAVFFGDGNGVFTYCTFDGMKCPPGHMLVPDNCNVSYSTFVGAVLYDGDTLASPGRPGGIGEYTACYCDFTNVKGGWFQETVLVGSTFRGADLRTSTFEWANLCDVDFTGALVTDQAFTTALTGNAYLGGAGNNRPPYYGMFKATYNDGTVFPPGIDISLMVHATNSLAIAASLEPFLDATGLTFTSGDLGGAQVRPGTYDGNFRDATFVPLSADSFHMNASFYNSNLRGVTWKGGYLTDTYQCNFGSPAPRSSSGRSSVGAVASAPRTSSLPDAVKTPPASSTTANRSQSVFN